MLLSANEVCRVLACVRGCFVQPGMWRRCLRVSRVTRFLARYDASLVLQLAFKVLCDSQLLCVLPEA